MICHHCLWLLFGAFMGILRLVLKIRGGVIQRGSEAKVKFVWLKTLNVCGFFSNERCELKILLLTIRVNFYVGSGNSR